MKKYKTNDKDGFSRYTKANVDSGNNKVKDFISTPKQFHTYQMIIYKTIPCWKELFITSIGDSYDNGKTIKNVTL